MSLQDQMTVTADAARRAKLDIKNAQARARRAAAKIAAQGPTAVKLDETSTAGFVADVDIPKDASPELAAKIAKHAPALKAGAAARDAYDAAKANATVKALMEGKLMQPTPVPTGKIPLSPLASGLDEKAAARAERLAEQDKVLAAKKQVPTKVAPIKASKAPKAAPVASAAKPAGASVAKKPNVKVALLDLFYSPAGFSGNIAEAVARLQAQYPGMNESSIRVWISDFVKDGTISKTPGADGKALLNVGVPGKFTKVGPQSLFLQAAPAKAPVATEPVTTPSKNRIVKTVKAAPNVVQSMVDGLKAIQQSGKAKAKKAAVKA